MKLRMALCVHRIYVVKHVDRVWDLLDMIMTFDLSKAQNRMLNWLIVPVAS